MKPYYILLLIIGLHACVSKKVKIISGEKFETTSSITVHQYLADSSIQRAIVHGKIIEVCQHKGCWVGIEDTTTHEKLFISFKDEAFSVPKNVGDRMAYAKVSKTENVDESYNGMAEASGIIVE
jgi:hypothetical protein